MFYRVTKFSRPKLGFMIALFMLFAPALIAATVESAPQRNKPKTSPPTPKKKATPDKKQPAKADRKNDPKTASKNKSADRRAEKTSAARNERKTADKNKNDKSKNSRTADRNSKSADQRNSKQNLAANNRIPSKTAKNERNARNERNAKTADRNQNASSKNARSAADKNRASSRNAKPEAVRTSIKSTPRPRNETRSKTADTRNNAENTAEKTIPTTAPAAFPDVIVSTFSVPVRSQASQSAPLLSNIKLGTVLRVAEKKPEWYKVQFLADGQTATGWITANAANDLNVSSKTDVYRQIVEKNYKPQMDFETAAEFYQFASKVGDELDGSEKSAEIELKRLLALRSALRTIPADRRENLPYRDFLKAREKEIVYNEPAGEWLVVSNEFWSLHNKYKKMTVAENIAWEAANNPLPGECEGYVNCYLFDMRMRFGEYLNLHPNGTRAGEALRNMTDYLSPIAADAQQKTVYNGPTDVTDRAEFNNLIAELRTIVARLPFVEKEKTLQQLRTIAEAYR